MSNPVENDVFIYGPAPELARFEADARPKKGGHGDNCCGTTEDGPLCVDSLLPPLPPLLEEQIMTDTYFLWYGHHIYMTERLDCPDGTLGYSGRTNSVCAAPFAINVSKRYPDLSFRLVWDLFADGEYGFMAAQDGRVTEYIVEHSWVVLRPRLAELNIVLPFRYRDPWEADDENPAQPGSQ